MSEINRAYTRRTQTRQVLCGGVPIGGGAPVPIQSMTNTRTEDAAATAAQIGALAKCGADIVRCAIPTLKAAITLREIRERLEASGLMVPIVGDIHFDYRIALEAIKAGVDKIRINPGNIGKAERVKAVVDAAGAAGIPIRIGVNGGSLEADLQALYQCEPAKALAESARRNIDLARGMGFESLVVSIKSSDVLINTEAHRLLAAATDLPLHIGITEAGFGRAAVVKSAAGIGVLLAMGIGDTIRVSLTGNPLQEVVVARDILRSFDLLRGQITLLSCPTCGRCQVDMTSVCEKVSAALTEKELARITAAKDLRRNGIASGEDRDVFEGRLLGAERPIVAAVMGCGVNGPGEASHADLGVACGAYGGLYFEKGVKGDVVPMDKIVQKLLEGVDALT